MATLPVGYRFHPTDDEIQRVMAMLPVGYRFHPTDDEIISHYLKLKMNGHDDRFIGEIDLCKSEPWELPDRARMKSDDQVWYFFCRPDYKYSNSKRASRATKTGFWKLTGKVRYVKAKGSEEVIGSKRTLVFYSKARNRSTKAIRKNWVIHEYQAKTGHSNQGSFVVIKLKYKANELSENLPQDGGKSSLIRTRDVETCAAVEEDDEDEFMNTIIDSIGMDFNHPLSSPQSRIPSEHEFPCVNLLGANSSGNYDGASTSQFHADKDDPELAKFADAFLNIPDSGTSQTLPDEFDDEQGLLENRKLSSPHHDLQRKEHGVQSDDILVMGSGHEIKSVEQLGVDDFIVEKVEYQEDLSGSVLTKKVNEAKKRRADVPPPKQLEKPKEPSRSFHSTSNSNSATNVYTNIPSGRGFMQSETPPSSHGQSPHPKRPEKPKVPPKPSGHVTSDSNSRTNVSTNVRLIGGFIRPETSPSSHAQNPPSVYIINMAVGVLLLVCCIWELLVRH